MIRKRGSYAPNSEKQSGLTPWLVIKAQYSVAFPGGLYERSVLGAIFSHCDKDGTCFPSAKTLAEETGISERQVYRVIKNLKKQGLVEWESRKGRSTRYFLTADVFEQIRRMAKSGDSQSSYSQINGGEPLPDGQGCNGPPPHRQTPLTDRQTPLPDSQLTPATQTDISRFLSSCSKELIEVGSPGGEQLAKGENLEETEFRTDDQTPPPTVQEIASAITTAGKALADKVGDETYYRAANQIADEWLKEPLASKTARNLKNLAIGVGLTPEEVGFPDVKKLHLARSLEKVSKKSSESFGIAGGKNALP